ncbi:branched-chain amino acid ABC transporter permease [Chitinasiproducens palmae]|uniref:Amino acid/amide ABC transporter membrane protein 1, HAAT family n=1 Tax=Chitinasiproducens palmae TaxID=1770053 RepID=A0A1H2PTU9_9BURK|nr:branched-chain amino acid ABC transporter permease [Chitinasiproducens palmae]SDV50576.1 amino acid/amide ABC transporter membrane protein 1, HAAT family [Chitinasiproducens palmae]
MNDLVQLLVSGLTVGSVYAVVAIGFTLIYAASDVVNFAQGEFVMIGGLTTVFLSMHGVPLWAAAPLAVLVAIVAGLLLQKLAIEPARQASDVSLVIITLGASIFIRGVAELVFDKQFHSLPPISSRPTVHMLGASITTQSLWVLGSTLAMFAGLYLFLQRTVTGKGLRACASNRLAAKLVGINISLSLCLAYGLSAALGALAGVLVTPITLTRYDIGVLLAMKGFSAALLGGIGNPLGAVLGGLLLGLLESLAAGYLTSVYKDGVAFVALILVLLTMPGGLLGSKAVERV